MPAKSMLFLLLFFGLCAGSLRFPLLGVLNYMGLYLFAPNHEWWMRAIMSLGIRFYLIAGLCLILGMIFNWSDLKTRVRERVPLEWWFVVFLAICWTSSLVGMGPDENTAGLLEKMTKLVIFMFMMTHAVTRLDDYRWVRRLWVMGGLYLGLRCTLDYAPGRVTGIGGPDFAGSSGLSAHLAFTMVFIGVTFLMERKWWWRAVSVIAGALVVNGLVQMRTRGAFLGLIVGAVAAIILMPGRYRGKILVGMIVAGAMGFALTDNLYWERMGTITAGESEMGRSASVRLTLWRHSLSVLNDYPLGVGIGNFGRAMTEYAPGLSDRASHNTIVRLVVDLGIQGLIAYLAILWLALKSLIRTKRLALKQGLDDVALEATTLALALVVAMTAGMFTERTYVEGYWWLFAMAVCLERSTLNAVLPQEPAPEPDKPRGPRRILAAPVSRRSLVSHHEGGA